MVDTIKKTETGFKKLDEMTIDDLQNIKSANSTKTHLDDDVLSPEIGKPSVDFVEQINDTNEMLFSKDEETFEPDSIDIPDAPHIEIPNIPGIDSAGFRDDSAFVNNQRIIDAIELEFIRNNDITSDFLCGQMDLFGEVEVLRALYDHRDTYGCNYEPDVYRQIIDDLLAQQLIQIESINAVFDVNGAYDENFISENARNVIDNYLQQAETLTEEQQKSAKEQEKLDLEQRRLKLKETRVLQQNAQSQRYEENMQAKQARYDLAMENPQSYYGELHTKIVPLLDAIGKIPENASENQIIEEQDLYANVRKIVLESINELGGGEYVDHQSAHSLQTSHFSLGAFRLENLIGQFLGNHSQAITVIKILLADKMINIRDVFFHIPLLTMDEKLDLLLEMQTENYNITTMLNEILNAAPVFLDKGRLSFRRDVMSDLIKLKSWLEAKHLSVENETSTANLGDSFANVLPKIDALLNQNSSLFNFNYEEHLDCYFKLLQAKFQAIYGNDSHADIQDSDITHLIQTLPSERLFHPEIKFQSDDTASRLSALEQTAVFLNKTLDALSAFSTRDDVFEFIDRTIVPFIYRNELFANSELEQNICGELLRKTLQVYENRTIPFHKIPNMTPSMMVLSADLQKNYLKYAQLIGQFGNNVFVNIPKIEKNIPSINNLVDSFIDYLNDLTKNPEYLHSLIANKSLDKTSFADIILEIEQVKQLLSHKDPRYQQLHQHQSTFLATYFVNDLPKDTLISASHLDSNGENTHSKLRDDKKIADVAQVLAQHTDDVIRGYTNANKLVKTTLNNNSRMINNSLKYVDSSISIASELKDKSHKLFLLEQPRIIDAIRSGVSAKKIASMANSMIAPNLSDHEVISVQCVEECKALIARREIVANVHHSDFIKAFLDQIDQPLKTRTWFSSTHNLIKDFVQSFNSGNFQRAEINLRKLGVDVAPTLSKMGLPTDLKQAIVEFDTRQLEQKTTDEPEKTEVTESSTSLFEDKRISILPFTTASTNFRFSFTKTKPTTPVDNANEQNTDENIAIVDNEQEEYNEDIFSFDTDGENLFESLNFDFTDLAIDDYDFSNNENSESNYNFDPEQEYINNLENNIKNATQQQTDENSFKPSEFDFIENPNDNEENPQDQEEINLENLNQQEDEQEQIFEENSNFQDESQNETQDQEIEQHDFQEQNLENEFLFNNDSNDMQSFNIPESNDNINSDLSGSFLNNANETVDSQSSTVSNAELVEKQNSKINLLSENNVLGATAGALLLMLGAPPIVAILGTATYMVASSVINKMKNNVTLVNQEKAEQNNKKEEDLILEDDDDDLYTDNPNTIANDLLRNLGKTQEEEEQQESEKNIPLDPDWEEKEQQAKQEEEQRKQAELEEQERQQMLEELRNSHTESKDQQTQNSQEVKAKTPKSVTANELQVSSNIISALSSLSNSLKTFIKDSDIQKTRKFATTNKISLHQEDVAKDFYSKLSQLVSKVDNVLTSNTMTASSLYKELCEIRDFAKSQNLDLVDLLKYIDKNSGNKYDEGFVKFHHDELVNLSMRFGEYFGATNKIISFTERNKVFTQKSPEITSDHLKQPELNTEEIESIRPDRITPRF